MFFIYLNWIDQSFFMIWDHCFLRILMKTLQYFLFLADISLISFFFWLCFLNDFLFFLSIEWKNVLMMRRVTKEMLSASRMFIKIDIFDKLKRSCLNKRFLSFTILCNDVALNLNLFFCFLFASFSLINAWFLIFEIFSFLFWDFLQCSESVFLLRLLLLLACFWFFIFKTEESISSLSCSSSCLFSLVTLCEMLRIFFSFCNWLFFLDIESEFNSVLRWSRFSLCFFHKKDEVWVMLCFMMFKSVK